MNSEDPVFGFSVLKQDFSDIDLTEDDVDRMLSRTGNGHVMEDVEDCSVRLEVYGEDGDFNYEVRVMYHDGPDWDDPTIGETDKIHSASTKTYRGEVPEGTEVYREARKIEESMFR
ncbi:hypothetical protein ACK3SF_00960 [Candidatus Nanosalina sp. VS9-1]|uniref:hypothetical protein n=1 Tax=Candidatus Nanosalina sp. VS9-1 TaxID=3388566 RepID=UPI0039E0CE37